MRKVDSATIYMGFALLVIVLSLVFLSQCVHAAEPNTVTTIAGTGAAGQSRVTTDHPRHISIMNGATYFIDGDHDHSKLRKVEDSKLSTVVDLAKSPLVARAKRFVDTGLAAAHNTLFVSSYERLYKVAGNRITEVSHVNTYLKEHHVEYVYKIKPYRDHVLIMGWMKQQMGSYAFLEYDPADNSIQPLLDNIRYPYSPNNFYPDDDGILVSTEGGLIFYEKLSPRKTIQVLYNGNGNILDAWTSASGYLHYSLVTASGTENKILKDPRAAEDLDQEELVAGGTRGYRDGVMDEVQLDFAKDFMWDGSGYIFSDYGNNMIRKLWVDDPPTNIIQ